MTPNDELCLRIGRIARAHVEIDVALRRVYVTLATPGNAVFLANNNPSTNRLVDDCRSMLDKAVVGGPFRELAKGVFEAVKAANNDRNRVVHDMWLPQDVTSDESPTWQGFQARRGLLGSQAVDSPRDLTFLDELLTTMQRTLIRVFAMNWALQHVLPFFDGSFVPGEDRDRELGRWLATMDGQFTLLEDGGWRVEGDRPDAGGVGDGSVMAAARLRAAHSHTAIRALFEVSPSAAQVRC